MMRVHGKPVNADFGTSVNRPRCEWTMKQGDERFWQAAGEGLQAVSESCTENESLVHPVGLAAVPIYFKLPGVEDFPLCRARWLDKQGIMRE
jgi:hypothetical protein